MTRRVVTDQQAGFGSGLNTVSDPAFLRPDQARQMANLRLANYGAALKRLGTQLTTASAVTTFDSTSSNFTSVYGGLYWPYQDKIYLMAASTASQDLHLYSTAYGSFPVTWTDLGAIPHWRPVIFTDNSALEVMYVAGNNNLHPYKFDGTTIAALGVATEQASGLCVYNDRLWGWFGGPSTGKGNRLFYSNLASAVGSTGGDSFGDTSAGGGTIYVRTFGNSSIVACAPVNGSLLIWHQRGISVLTGWGQDDVQVQPQALNAEVGMGTATADGVVVANELSTGDIAYFVTDLGIYVTNGGFVRPLGTPDKPDPTAALLRAGTTDPSQFVLSFSRQFNELWVGIIGVGIYVYNVILEAWSGPFTGSYASGLRKFFEVIDTAGNSKLWRIAYNGTAGTGVFVSECDRAGVYKDDVTSAGTGGTAVTATLQLHRMFGGDRAFAKSWRWLNLLATLTSGATPPVVSYMTPISGTSTTTMSGLTSVETQYYVPLGGTGGYLDATISDAGTTGPSQYALASVQGNFLGQR